MTLKRRELLQAGGAILGAAMLPATARAQAGAAHEFVVKDIVYHRDDKPRLARLYQPAGSGPFPAVLQVHGGAWNNKNRTDGQNTALDLAAAGIVVLSIDFRNAPEAPYPASLQDINLRHPLAQGPRRRVRQQRRPGRRLRHLERRPSNPARGDPPGRSALSRAAARRRARHGCQARLRGVGLGRAVSARALQARQGQGRRDAAPRATTSSSAAKRRRSRRRRP